MSINVSQKPEMNVVNVGDEITADQLAAITNAQAPTAANPFLTRANSFNTADAAVRITQTGTGEAFLVEDAASPDGSVFVINADGNIGIGRSATARKVEILGNTAVTGVLTVDSSGSAGAIFTQGSGTGVPLTIQNNGTGNSFVVNDDSGDTTPFVITADGSVAIGKTTVQAGYLLDVQGAIRSAGSSLLTAAANIQPVLTVLQTGSADAVRITNTGSGNSFVVEDDANPDATPFVIDSSGRVGVGTANPASGYNFNVLGLSYFRNTSGAGGDPVVYVRQEGAGNKVALHVTNQGSGHSLLIEDSSGDSTPFIIDNAGNVTIGGTLQFGTEGAVSSLTYKTTGLAATVDRTAFPNEVEIVIAGVTYRIPARQV